MRDARTTRGLRSIYLLGMGMGWLGCTGSIGSVGQREPVGENVTNRGGSSGGGAATGSGSAGGTSSGGTGNGGTGNGGTGGDPSDELSWPVMYDGKPSPLRRLSRDEIINTIQAAVGVAPSRDDLPLDRRSSAHALFTTTGAALIASEVDKLANALTDVAVRAAPGALTRSQCRATGATQKSCLGAYAERLAAQAFRRAVTAEESTRLRALFANAGVSAADDKLAVEMMIFTTFFSPSFLYRVETSPEGAATLSGNAIAERLAFLATGLPADAELLSAAKAGKLLDSQARAAQFDRLSRTPAGLKTLAAFVLDHMGATESQVANKSARYLANLPQSYASDVRASAVSAITATLGADTTGNFEQLFTTTAYLRDAAVQTIVKDVGTGATATGDGQAAQRMGLLMHPYVLSAITKENGSSPFPIGLFIRQHLLCETIPPAPPGAVAMAREEAPAGLSERKDFEYRTNATPVCTACHATFSPLGYSYMPFDPLGRWTKQDATGQPWDLTGEVDLYSGDLLAFDSPKQLAQGLSGSAQAHGCFAQSALVWALGRRPVQQDEALLRELDSVAGETKGEVRALFRTIVMSDVYVQTNNSNDPQLR